MTTVQFNHTPMSIQMGIEEAISSGGYGEQMVRLAGQFRWEGNHDAANAAFMAAAQIRDMLSTATDLLPIIVPEHTTLLSPSD